MTDFKDKKVLILGLGVNQGGLGSAKFFAKAKAVVRVTDLKGAKELKPSLDQLKEYKNISYVLGKHRFEDIDWADLIIRNQAIKPDNPYLRYALKKDKRVEMDMGIFLQFVSPKQVIGVTGTKGKSTTASLIYQALKKAKKKAVFAGNIGISVLDSIPYIRKDCLVVLELSSFQLQAWRQHKVSPRWAVITNIFPDHLNWYKSMEDYVKDKRSIGLNQSDADYLFLAKGDPVTTKRPFLKGLYSKVVYFSAEDLPKNLKLQIPGEHNLANAAVALQVVKTLGVSQKDALEAFKKFEGVEFRLQLIKTWRGVKIYNDTAATNPAAATQALRTFPQAVLIAGGVNKNLSYKGFAQAIERYAKVVFFLEGDATGKIKKHIKSKDKIIGIYNNFSDLLKSVKQYVKAGDVILLSPGAASFNLFQNEFDRGRKFNLSAKRIFR